MKRSYFGSGLRRLAAAVLVIILAAATAVSGGVFKTMATGSYQYSVNTEADLGLVKLQDNTYAVQFAACADMSAVELYVAKTSSNSATALTARLYGWRGSYSESVRQTPVAEKRFEGFEIRKSRREELRETPFGTVRFKKAEGYGVSREKPEYEDIARIAKEKDMSAAEVRAALAD